MVVKQASALLRERVEGVMTSTTLAEHWIEISPTARNAFIYALADGGYMLLYHGMLTVPYASPRTHRPHSNCVLVYSLSRSSDSPPGAPSRLLATGCNCGT